MRLRRRKYALRWLITPEDSSRWEAGGMGDCTNDQDKKKSIYSISKLLGWYLVALIIPIVLSRLHWTNILYSLIGTVQIRQVLKWFSRWSACYAEDLMVRSFPDGRTTQSLFWGVFLVIHGNMTEFLLSMETWLLTNTCWMLLEIKSKLNKIKDDSAVRAVVISGTGDKAFSAGADIKYLSQASPLQVRELAMLAVSVTRLIENLGKI